MDESFWNFAQSTAVWLPCSVLIFIQVSSMKKKLWTNEWRDLNLRPISDCPISDATRPFVFEPKVLATLKIEPARQVFIFFISLWNFTTFSISLINRFIQFKGWLQGFETLRDLNGKGYCGYMKTGPGGMASAGVVRILSIHVAQWCTRGTAVSVIVSDLLGLDNFGVFFTRTEKLISCFMYKFDIVNLSAQVALQVVFMTTCGAPSCGNW